MQIIGHTNEALSDPLARTPTFAAISKAEGYSRSYQKIARAVTMDMISGKYDVGSRLPAERELSVQYNVSRPVIREALIALEAQGFVEVRVGAGAFVRRIPGDDGNPGFAVSAFELTEARRVFEGEAAALAALHINDTELADLERLISQMSSSEQPVEVTESADREFHLTIARASRNLAVEMTIDQFWKIRTTSPECALLHDKACLENVRPSENEHRRIVQTLRSGDPDQARMAMRAHLSSVMEQLLFAAEADAIRNIKRVMESTRTRFINATGSVHNAAIQRAHLAR